MHADSEVAVVDTAALDAWLAEHLLGWRMLEGQLVPPEMARLAEEEGENFPLKPHAPVLSTTGDGMVMVDSAVDEKHNGMLVLERSINHAFAAQYVCRECDEEYGWSMGPEAANVVARAAKSYVQGHAVTDKGCSFAGTAQAARAALEAEA